jgi:hypothetical protein
VDEARRDYEKRLASVRAEMGQTAQLALHDAYVNDNSSSLSMV